MKHAFNYFMSALGVGVAIMGFRVAAAEGPDDVRTVLGVLLLALGIVFCFTGIHDIIHDITGEG